MTTEHIPKAKLERLGWTNNNDLPNRFFVKTPEEEILLLTREEGHWWVADDYTQDDYDSNWDTSGTMSHDRLLTNLRNGEYTRIPDSEGWTADEKNNQTTNQSDNQTI